MEGQREAIRKGRGIFILFLIIILLAISLFPKFTAAVTITQVSGCNAPDGSFTVTNSSGGLLCYSFSSDKSCLSFPPLWTIPGFTRYEVLGSPYYCLDPGKSAKVGVKVDNTNLSPGTYNATITINELIPQWPPLPPKNVYYEPVTVNIAPRTITYSPASVSATVVEGCWLTPKTITVTNANQCPCYSCYTYSSNQSWLSATPGAGFSTLSPGGTCLLNQGDAGTVNININSAGLAPGDYKGNISISSGNATENIPVALEITPITIPLSPSSISVVETLSCPATSKTFTVTNPRPCYSYIRHSFSSDQPWLSAAPQRGDYWIGEVYLVSTGHFGKVNVNFNTTGLAPGTYTGNISINSGNSTATIPVTLTKAAADDSDNDGHRIPGSCRMPNDDCDDNDSSIYPGASEICDGHDNNCNGQVDEGCAVCEDKDGDGHYAISSPCPQGNDCNDNDASVHPGAAEICNGKDNDCNGATDDIPEVCYTGPIGTQGIGICKTGTHFCTNGTYSACFGVITPEEEICDGLDNNCDGIIDEGCWECPISPLTPLTDPLAIRMENGENIIYDGLTAGMQQAVDCFSNAVSNAGGSLTVTSAYRPPQYQEHLREVWDKYMRLTDEDNPVGQECDELRNEVSTEFQNHGLLRSQQPAANSRHTAGTAIDARATLPPGQNIDTLANNCDLYRPFIRRDPVHFEIRR